MTTDTSRKLFTLIALLSITAILLHSMVSSVFWRQQAEQYLDDRIELLARAASRGEAMRIRFDLAADPVLRAVGVWQHNPQQNQLIFPDQQLLPHPGDHRITGNQEYLSELLQSAGPKIWDRWSLPGKQLFYCTLTEFSVCALIDSAELATAMHISHESLTQALFAPLAGLFDLLPLLLAGVVFGLIWRPFKRRQKPRLVTPETLANDHRFRLGDILVDTRCMRAYRAELCTDLSERDVRLLQHFRQHPDAVISKDELYNAAWGRDFVPSSRALEQHILTLRRKLDPERQRPVVIETVHGRGYRFPLSSSN